jgi:N-hydroxyarylamine O-acetyltransferase
MFWATQCYFESMNLDGYLSRIGYTGSLEPTLATLNALQAAHLSSIPYENLDIHLGRSLPLSETRAYEKLVLEKRGGWCYEMNTLFAWGLRQIGFEVRYLSSGVLRPGGTTPDGDHLILLVSGTYLADVGFGDGAIQALPLETGRYQCGFLEYGMSFDGTFWTMHNFPQSNTAGFVFQTEARDLGYFAERCFDLQTSEESGFVRTTVCQRMTKDALYTLRGAVLTTLSASGKLEQTITSHEDYKDTLLEHFRLELPESEALWEKIWARHLAWSATTHLGT